MTTMQQIERASQLARDGKYADAQAALDAIDVEQLSKDELLAYVRVAQPLGERQAFEES